MDTLLDLDVAYRMCMEQLIASERMLRHKVCSDFSSSFSSSYSLELYRYANLVQSVAFSLVNLHISDQRRC